ncbi:LysR family transcriptional regulator [Brevundimonas aveniformis]|uniref:LysR family transcriptional regulator n=1 Tax=Brevundimonas aveniformis TaxID=370977 RepID=UPI0024924A14|nr:LysR family transcriptional regulator [Brevundimonas aveniformis]
MKTPDWDHLRDFLAVARTGRLTTAARVLAADHTTVSRRIVALEAALQARLFDRSPQGYALTAHGERLMLRAEAMESLMLAAQAEVGEADLSVSGVVRIGAPEGFGSYFLAPRLPRLAELHPDLEIQLVAIPGTLSLSKREADVAITLSPPREGRLISRKLTDYRLSLYGAPAYLDARPAITSRADMKDQRFIGYIEDLLYAPELDYMQAPDVDIHVAFKSSNLIAQLQACVAGAGLAVIPDFIAEGRPYLRRVLADQVGLTREFHLVVHADLRSVARVRAVMDFIAGAVKAERGVFGG